jgi:hypothetical protein
MDLRKLTVNELLTLGVDATQELRSRGIVRTANNPIGDFAEYLFCRAFSWKLADNSQKDADAVGPDGVRYQIKARRLAGNLGDRQLSALRNLPDQRFDKLAAVLFDKRFGIARAVIIPHALVVAKAVHQTHTNSWRFILRDEVWSWRGVEDVTMPLRGVLQFDLREDLQGGLNQPAPAKHRQSWLSRLVKFGRVPDRE